MPNKLFVYGSLCCTMALLLFCAKAKAQLLSVQDDFMQAGSRMALFSTDYYKTDFRNAFDKAQIGMEAGYFFSNSFMASGGLDLWTDRSEPIITLGSRYYPSPPFFIRQRALIKHASDVSLGVGFSFLLSERWVLETIGDYYLNQNEFSFRISFGIFIPETKKSP